MSLPFRPAPVLARATASLDRLSHGRVEPGIGPGAFWDAIEALGIPRRTLPESVTALERAVHVIRGIWDTSLTEALHSGGPLVHVHGAKRGPAPAHRIPIVLGAYKPRMLNLTGRLADGWIPSLGYLRPGDLTDGNTAIDAAARAAGRAPADITRYLIVPPGLTPTELSRYVGSVGVSAFLLASDDPALITSWAITACEVRDRVADNRAPHTVAIAHDHPYL